MADEKQPVDFTKPIEMLSLLDEKWYPATFVKRLNTDSNYCNLVVSTHQGPKAEGAWVLPDGRIRNVPPPQPAWIPAEGEPFSGRGYEQVVSVILLHHDGRCRLVNHYGDKLFRVTDGAFSSVQALLEHHYPASLSKARQGCEGFTKRDSLQF